MDYLSKNVNELHLTDTLSWNFPEQKRGNLVILGGNLASFATEVKIATFGMQKFGFLENVVNVFPSVVKKHLPPLPNLYFTPANSSGSFAKSAELRNLFTKTLPERLEKQVDFAIYSGDFSKNSETAVAIGDLLVNSPEVPALLTRDGVDLVMQEAENFVGRENLAVVASMAQLQKLFRALYYPKVLLLSMPFPAVAEVLHKFTLSYPISILTLHDGQILACKEGKILALPIEKSEYSPVSLWMGEVAIKIAVFMMFNQKNWLESLVAGVEY